jgi:hypothetical protein
VDGAGSDNVTDDDADRQPDPADWRLVTDAICDNFRSVEFTLTDLKQKLSSWHRQRLDRTIHVVFDVLVCRLLLVQSSAKGYLLLPMDGTDLRDVHSVLECRARPDTVDPFRALSLICRATRNAQVTGAVTWHMLRSSVPRMFYQFCSSFFPDCVGLMRRGGYLDEQDQLTVTEAPLGAQEVLIGLRRLL